MLIPIGHENMQGRRWPFITIALIVINVIAFLGTHSTIDEQNPKRAEARMHLLLLAAMHPELKVPENVSEFVSTFHNNNPDAWAEAASPYRHIMDGWDARIRLVDDTQVLQQEMDSLAQQYEGIQQTSVLEKYAFIPAHHSPMNYLTANFLHGGWLHIIGNMWFLWLAGLVLEDTWGRLIYPLFYLIAGAFALQFYAWFNPGSLVPTLGASGAVAALMGAFLIRFPKTKIEMMWIFGLLYVRAYRFKACAYWLLPVWLLMEVFSGALFGQSSGVAHWAHVGGFVFGAVAALGIRYSGLEHKANQAIEAKVSWTGDAGVVKASEWMEQGKLEEAATALQQHLAAKPDSIDALSLLQQLQWRKNDVPAYRETTIKLCQAHLKAQDGDAAWHAYEEFTNSGGDRMPASTWLELCRAVEAQQNFERAADEYERLAKAYPAERQSLLAVMAAGRISLKKLNRPSDALRFYKAAAASSVPHLDWETNIQAGIKEAEKALAGAPAPVASS